MIINSISVLACHGAGGLAVLQTEALSAAANDTPVSANDTLTPMTLLTDLLTIITLLFRFGSQLYYKVCNFRVLSCK